MIIGMDRTLQGRIRGCWTGTGDKADGSCLLATSDDDGGTWSKPRLAVNARTEAAHRIGGVLVGNLRTDPKGRLWLFFDQQRGDSQKRITNWFLRCDAPDAAEPVWTAPAMFAEGCTLNKPTGPKPILHNGIELPYEWPPRDLDPDSDALMPVPYLQRRPASSISIDVGRQLFVDDFLIEKTDMQRVFHQARKHRANPVFKAETKDELAASTR